MTMPTNTVREPYRSRPIDPTEEQDYHTGI